MANPFWFEVIGYVGSALLILSLTRRSIFRLRVIGLASSGAFFVYSILIQAFPIAVVNVIVAGIHVYFILRLTRRPDEVFSLLEVDPDSTYLRAFLDFHADDIERFQPNFSESVADSGDDCIAVFVLRDMVPAALVLGRPGASGDEIEVLLDYAIPQYRDFRLGNYLYSNRSRIFGEAQFRTATATAVTPDHVNYLERVGFERCDGDRFEKTLS